MTSKAIKIGCLFIIFLSPSQTAHPHSAIPKKTGPKSPPPFSPVCCHNAYSSIARFTASIISPGSHSARWRTGLPGSSAMALGSAQPVF